jgi:glycosyltransferase involved in cell wall biosynthesis
MKKPNLPQLNRRDQPKRDILVVSRVFPPDPGGIQEYIYNRCLQDPERIIVLSAHCSGDAEFDIQQNFPVYRWVEASLFFPKRVGGIFKQIFYLFWQVVFGIQLFFRYRYRYIEWAHGYDFPAILLLSYLLPIRFFVYLHGDDVLCPLKNFLFKRLFELTLRRADAIACNSKFTQKFLESHFRISTPIHVMNPTVRPAKFGDSVKSMSLEALRSQVRSALNIPTSSIVILSVGRLVRRKGFERIIEQLPRLLADGIDAYYLICGTGPMEKELQIQAKQRGVASRVVFAGYVSDQDLAGFYSACDIFALVTFFDATAKSIEGFGIVYLEAGLFSKPVIASRSGGVEDAVWDGETGILVEPDSTEEIYVGLSKLCIDKRLREDFGLRGYQRAQLQPCHSILYSSSSPSQSFSSQETCMHEN